MILCSPGNNRLKIKDNPCDEIYARYKHLYLYNQQKPQKVIDRFIQAKVSEIGVSSITLSELEYGVIKSVNPEQNKLALTQFVAPIEIPAYDDAAAQHYGKVRAYLERQGTPIGTLDMLIAAHAVSLNAVLITNNEKKFKRVSKLQIENWAK